MIEKQIDTNVRTITIRDAHNGALLASAPVEAGVQLFEGAWYFDQEQVQMHRLIITDRTYTCPYKGVCYWIDMESEDGHTCSNIGFTYFKVNPGYESFKDQIGFYAGKREATFEES